MKIEKNRLCIYLLFVYLYFIPFKYIAAQSASNSFMVSINVNDSLFKISKSNDKQEKVNIYLNTAINLAYSKSDSAIILINKAELLAKEINSSQVYEKLYLIYSNIENIYTGNYISALYHAFYALNFRKSNLDQNLSTELNSNSVWGYKSPYNDVYYLISYVYAHLGNKEKCLEYLNKIDSEVTSLTSSKNRELTNDTRQRVVLLGDIYLLINDIEKAKKYFLYGQKINKKLPFLKQWGIPYVFEGNLFVKIKDFDNAIDSYNNGMNLQLYNGRYKGVMESNFGIAEAYLQQNKIDSAIKFANTVLELDKNYDFTLGVLKTYNLLYKGYKIKNQSDKAFIFLEKANELKDSLYNTNKLYEAQNFAISEQQKNDLLDEQKEKTRIIIVFISILFVVLIVIFLLVQKNIQKRKYAKIEEERKAQELEAAKKLQIGFLPKKIPQREDLEIVAYTRTSTEVGGDYYDFMVKPNNTILSICGDATGHGVASGMMVSVTKTSLFSINEDATHLILTKLNEVVRKIELGTLRMSLNIVEIASTKILISSAAMPPIYLYKAKSGEVEEINQSNLPLGGFKNESFDLIEKSFEPGDVLMQLTDGLPEAPNSKNELYDYFRVGQHLASVGSKTADEIKNSFITETDNWLGGGQNPDDITFIIIKKIK
jgi:serine phosphatase RsbU (regulator of sigma subunit)